MLIEVIFDLETKKFFGDIGSKDPSLLGVSVVSLYRRELDSNFTEVKGEMLSFWESEFSRMWPIFSEAKRIIGFNSIGFDIPALKPYSPFTFAKLPHLDIYLELKKKSGHGASLDSIAKSTLGKYKIDSGANAVLYWDKGDNESLAKLKKYCEEDVAITRDVYDFVFRNGYLTFNDRWNNPRRVELNFPYNTESPDSFGQTSLF